MFNRYPADSPAMLDSETCTPKKSTKLNEAEIEDTEADLEIE